MHTSADHGAHGVSGTAEEGETGSEQQEGASSGTEGLSRSDRHSGTAANAVRHRSGTHTLWARSEGQCKSQIGHVTAGACRAGRACARKSPV